MVDKHYTAMRLKCFLQEKQKHVTFSLYHQWAKLEKLKKLTKNSLSFSKILLLSY